MNYAVRNSHIYISFLLYSLQQEKYTVLFTKTYHWRNALNFHKVEVSFDIVFHMMEINIFMY